MAWSGIQNSPNPESEDVFQPTVLNMPTFDDPPAQPAQRDALGEMMANRYLPNPFTQASSKPSTTKANAPKPFTPAARLAPIEDIDDDDPRLERITLNCDQIRRRINTFINSGAMKVGEFQKAADIGANSYRFFMKQNGPHSGCNSNAYQNAWVFFKKRELAGIPMPRKAAAKGTAGREGAKAEWDVSAVKLNGEETDSVEIYDTCDDLRRKVSAHLRLPGVTQASFCRSIATSFNTEQHKFMGRQIQDFLGKNGPMAGASSGVFYGAYVFFEKLRVRDGKPKSKKRLEMEELWKSEGGLQRKDVRHVTCRVDENVWLDSMGKLQIQRRGGSW